MLRIENESREAMIEFFVPGIPATAGSKKGFLNKKTGRVMIVPASNKQKPWMNTVTFFARQQYTGPLLKGPLKLEIEFRLLRPKSHYGTGRNSGVLKALYGSPYHHKRPDLTKFLRAVEDALTGFVWFDDAQVAIQETRKVYVDRDPGAMVRISEVIESKETTLFENTDETPDNQNLIS